MSHWKYTGGGQQGYLPGVPARDLTEQEWRDLDAETRATVRRLDLYEHVQDKPKAGKAKAEAAPKEPEPPAEGADQHAPAASAGQEG